MDVSLCIELLLPAADYRGSLTENTEAQYDALVWLDARQKPTWAEVEDAWEGYAQPKTYRIYDYTPGSLHNPYNRPDRLDFITGLSQRLLPSHTFSFGELQQTTYYASRDENGYQTPVVKETFVYVRDEETGFPLSRQTKIQWYFSDGTLDESFKLLQKYYDDDPISTLNELARRRDNNVKNVIGALIGLVMATEPTMTRNDVLEDGRAFFDGTAGNRELYVYDGNYALIDDVRNEATLAWMDNDVSAIVGLPTIRSFIIYQLTFGELTE